MKDSFLQSCNQGNISLHFIFKELLRYTSIESWYALNFHPSLQFLTINKIFFILYYFLMEEIKSFALIKSEITNWSSL